MSVRAKIRHPLCRGFFRLCELETNDLHTAAVRSGRIVVKTKRGQMRDQPRRTGERVIDEICLAFTHFKRNGRNHAGTDIGERIMWWRNLILLFCFAGTALLLVRQIRAALHAPTPRAARSAKEAAAAAARERQSAAHQARILRHNHGPLNLAMTCPSCRSSGCVHVTTSRERNGPNDEARVEADPGSDATATRPARTVVSNCYCERCRTSWRNRVAANTETATPREMQQLEA